MSIRRMQIVGHEYVQTIVSLLIGLSRSGPTGPTRSFPNEWDINFGVPDNQSCVVLVALLL